MPLAHVRNNDDSLAVDISRLVNKALATYGVPVTVEQVEQLVDILYPRVVRMRRASWRTHVVELGRQAAGVGVEIKPEAIRPYPRKALFDAIADVVLWRMQHITARHGLSLGGRRVPGMRGSCPGVSHALFAPCLLPAGRCIPKIR